MTKEFVPYEQSLALKELGFDEPCFGVLCEEIKMVRVNDEPRNWNDNVRNGETTSAPTFSQCFRWFREKHNLHAEPYTADMGAIEYCFQIRDLYSERYIYDNFVGAGSSYMGTFNTPEEAELECLIKLIELVKNK
jgi:hypothetical protein